jgi:heme-degrading monooxygenase HmoA
MITEIAQIDVKPGTEKDFEAAVAKARPLFLRAKGGKGFELHKSIEKPSRYRLLAKWDTLENHTVDFRGSEDFMARAGRAVLCFAARSLTYRDGADLGGLNHGRWAASGRHRIDCDFMGLEMIDHDFHDRH